MAMGGLRGLIHLVASSFHQYQTVINLVAKKKYWLLTHFVSVELIRFSTVRDDPLINIIQAGNISDKSIYNHLRLNYEDIILIEVSDI